MPWSEVSPMDQKRLFIADHIRGTFTMTELCVRYDVSRKTGYKWIARFESEGLSGLHAVVRLVDSPRDLSRTDRVGPPRAERTARTDAPNAQTGNRETGCPDDALTTTPVRSVPCRVQQRASARSSRDAAAGIALLRKRPANPVVLEDRQRSERRGAGSLPSPRPSQPRPV